MTYIGFKLLFLLKLACFKAVGHAGHEPSKYTLHYESYDMITVASALSLILEQAKTFEAEQMPLQNCIGRTLAEDIYADRDYPPFNRSAMDGYACRSQDIPEFDYFRVIEEIHAGAFSAQMVLPGTCARIMTGAPVPQGADVVIKIEDSKAVSGQENISFTISNIRSGANISRQGEDCIKGDLLIENGTMINTGVYSTLAALGKSDVMVYKIPKVTIISTGNELKNIGEAVAHFQIRDSNSFSIESFLNEYKIPIHAKYIVRDDPEALMKVISAVQDSGIIFFSGGVSMGNADFVPAILKETGVKNLFHKVQVKPGKPLWFGITDRKAAVFALPGNPFSVQVALKIFAEPYLRCCMGLQPLAGLRLPLSIPKIKKTTFEEYFPCRLVNKSVTLAEPVYFNGSGDISAMLGTHGIARHPAGSDNLEGGSVVDFFPWRAIL
jgi:molybdopterin molybdotransferase